MAHDTKEESLQLGDVVTLVEGGSIRQRRWSDGFDRWFEPEGRYSVRIAAACDHEWFDASGTPLRRLRRRERELAADIPAGPRQIAASFGPFQWLALDAMRRVDGFTEFAAFDLANGGPGFIAVCWALARAVKRPPAERAALARSIMRIKRQTLVADLAGLEKVDPACLTLLARATLVDLTPEFIVDLLGLAGDPGARRALTSVARLNRWDIAALRATPPWAQQPRLTRIILESKIGPATIEAAFTPTLRAATPDEAARIRRSLLDACDWPRMAFLLARWDERLSRAAPFPPPPIPGDDRLVPIASAKALECEGRTMAHCVADYAREVRDGETYFYRWIGTERATVQLIRTSDTLEWRLAHALGRRNRRLPATEAAEIAALIQRQLPERPIRTFVAGTSHYDAAGLRGLLRPGHSLRLAREPGNSHDPHAIEVKSLLDVKLGYVPAALAATLAARLDQGESFAARVLAVDPKRPLDIEIVIERASKTDTRDGPATEGSSVKGVTVEPSGRRG